MSKKQRKQLIEPELREPSISRQCQLFEPEPVLVLLCAGSDQRRGPGADAADRRAVPENALLWQPVDGAAFLAAGPQGQPQTHSAPDATDGHRGGLSQAAHQPSPSRSTGSIPICSGTDIDHANQVWAADITYVPMARGFMYLVAVMDWHSRKILSWRVSNTLDSDFCNQPSRRPWNATASPRSSTRIKEPVYQQRVHPDPQGPRDRHQHGRPRPMPGQHLR